MGCAVGVHQPIRRRRQRISAAQSASVSMPAAHVAACIIRCALLLLLTCSRLSLSPVATKAVCRLGAASRCAVGRAPAHGCVPPTACTQTHNDARDGALVSNATASQGGRTACARWLAGCVVAPGSSALRFCVNTCTSGTAGGAATVTAGAAAAAAAAAAPAPVEGSDMAAGQTIAVREWRRERKSGRFLGSETSNASFGVSIDWFAFIFRNHISHRRYSVNQPFELLRSILFSR